MSAGSDIRSDREARAILRLAADAPPSTWRAAFQREVKAAHPDRGGDAERFRLVIEAYSFLRAQAPEAEAASTFRPGGPHPRPDPPQHRPSPTREPPPGQADPEPEPPGPQSVRISIVEAFRGCEKTVRLRAGKRFRVRLPAGLQTGDVVRFGERGEHRLTIAVEPLHGAELKGADLWIEVGVSREFLRDGGRIELDTPLGPRKFWVSRTSASRGLYRVPGEGLPARTTRPKGHLYLKFEHDPSLDQSPSKSLLKRFAAVWAAG